MNVSAIGYAIGAAIVFALSSALQHQAATGEQGYRSGLHLLWRLARNRIWLTGLAAAAIGVVLHAAALGVGALAVVQPLLVTSLALALPIRSLLDRARPSGRQALAAVVLAGAVAVFIAAVHPSAGQSAPHDGGAAAAIAVGVLIAGVSTSVARVRSGRVAGFSLGLAAGTLYGLEGGVLKALVHVAGQGPAALMTGWPLWTLAVLGVWALVVHQRAYTHAPLSVSLPALSVANPLAGIAFGVVVFGERPDSAPLALLAAAVSLCVIVASVTVLARASAEVTGVRVDPSDAARPGGGTEATAPGVNVRRDSPA